MALTLRKTTTEFVTAANWFLRRDFRALSTLPDKVDIPPDVTEKRLSSRRPSKHNPALEFRHIYPEFLPDPNPNWRNSLREKLERNDMLRRRNQIDIPEFYVGSILAVTISDPHAQGKTNRFVGICIERKGCGLRAEFILRNVVDHQGVEVQGYGLGVDESLSESGLFFIMYMMLCNTTLGYISSIPVIVTEGQLKDGEDKMQVQLVLSCVVCAQERSLYIFPMEVRYELYDPTIQTIQVLRLEKRLDEKLFYLRDALPEYSTFPFDMDQEILPEGTVVPLNPVQVKLKPRPWLERWERQDLKGVSNIEENLKQKDRVRRELRKTPWEKYDLMKTYRNTIPVEEQSEVWGEVYNQLHQLQLTRKKMSRKRTFTTPKTQLG